MNQRVFEFTFDLKVIKKFYPRIKFYETVNAFKGYKLDL